MKTRQDYCSRCKGTEHLIKNSERKNIAGELVTYFICRVCNNKKRASWYTRNQDKALLYNQRYLAKKKLKKLNK